MKLARYPYLARAWRGEVMVARSDACLCLERDGEPPELWFPLDDVELSFFGAGRTVPAPHGVGECRLWSVGETSTDGRDVLCEVTEPAAAYDALRGHGTFDPGRVRVEVVEDAPGGDPRDVTITRAPFWGDARDLIEMMDVQRVGDLHFVGAAHTDGRRPVVEGSQMLGQVIVAAGRHAPGRRVVSAGMLFLRGADAGRPLDFELEELSDGRTFTALRAQVRQAGRCCADGTLLLGAVAPEVVRHGVDPTGVPGPYECPPFDMGVTGRALRVVDGAYTSHSAAPVGPPTLDCWVRFRAVPADPPLHAGLLAQFTGHLPIAAALRPHAGIGQEAAHRTLSMGINAIQLSLHRNVRADEWMLYRHLSTFAGDGMTHAEGRVHDEGGALVASFTVDAMVRPFAPSDAPRDERTAL